MLPHGNAKHSYGEMPGYALNNVVFAARKVWGKHGEDPPLKPVCAPKNAMSNAKQKL